MRNRDDLAEKLGIVKTLLPAESTCPERMLLLFFFISRSSFSSGVLEGVWLAAHSTTA